MNRLCKSLMVLQVAAGFVGFVAEANAADAAKKPDLDRGKAIAGQVCASCHGADGNSASGSFPKLAGQHPEYLVKQLNDFKAQPGAKGPARNNAVMVGFASALSADDMRNVAAYYGSQTAKPGTARDAATVPIGQKIYRGGIADKGVPACASCHGPTGQGIPVQYPRLSGQWADYTVAQLTAFQQGVGARNNNEAMHQIASRLSDSEIKAVADYIAGLH
ncbi:c-type cytochrome [Burkholderia pseudomultivorans]|uniref:Cytochrome C n=2 Tax=Burkholderia cepacia complex TaxID=87882 RepID=A0A132F077_9BURK|nr:c-type cytochrome [Burkholderia pseudomultivorans]AIO32030.1 cytochrome c family protein [Burkholderia cenocepacia]AOI90974.1 cytochrome C [Burkholderia pseudomultivorans]KVC30767.1 cytochrome C [Burkholderia pseudomultivorans]KVC34012.1 cytochrome C [Burkholderia pseudomultivorans]KVC52000.1 cytochrome C [Burkholderia pseudomultivorans]